MAVMGYVLYLLIRDNLPRLLLLPLSTVSAGVAQIAQSIDQLLWRAGGVLRVFGFIELHSQSLELSQATTDVQAGNQGRDEGKRRQPADQGPDPPASPRVASPPHDAGRPERHSSHCEPNSLRSRNSV